MSYQQNNTITFNLSRKEGLFTCDHQAYFFRQQQRLFDSLRYYSFYLSANIQPKHSIHLVQTFVFAYNAFSFQTVIAFPKTNGWVPGYKVLQRIYRRTVVLRLSNVQHTERSNDTILQV
jgi:hypothetical protein